MHFALKIDILYPYWRYDVFLAATQYNFDSILRSTKTKSKHGDGFDYKQLTNVSSLPLTLIAASKVKLKRSFLQVCDVRGRQWEQ